MMACQRVRIREFRAGEVLLPKHSAAYAKRSAWLFQPGAGLGVIGISGAVVTVLYDG